jgi:hypothetical protein
MNTRVLWVPWSIAAMHSMVEGGGLAPPLVGWARRGTLSLSAALQSSNLIEVTEDLLQTVVPLISWEHCQSEESWN